MAEYESPAAEAAMFVAANRCRRAINRLDDFHAALVAGDEDAIEVNKIVTSVGLRVSRNTGSGAWAPGEVAFTNSVQKVIGRHGDTLAQSALSIIAVAFPGEVLTNGASIFLALAKLFAGNRGAVDHTTLQQALRHRSMKDWDDVVRLVKGGETRALAMTNAILEACETIDPAVGGYQNHWRHNPLRPARVAGLMRLGQPSHAHPVLYDIPCRAIMPSAAAPSSMDCSTERDPAPILHRRPVPQGSRSVQVSPPVQVGMVEARVIAAAQE